MGIRTPLISFFLLAAVLPAGANTLTANGLTLEPTHDYRFFSERTGLVNDGDFEDGSCLDGQSGWTCTTDNDCDWIVDLVPLGLWNYEGLHIAWLGGFCGGEPTCWIISATALTSPNSWGRPTRSASSATTPGAATRASATTCSSTTSRSTS